MAVRFLLAVVAKEEKYYQLRPLKCQWSFFSLGNTIFGLFSHENGFAAGYLELIWVKMRITWFQNQPV